MATLAAVVDDDVTEFIATPTHRHARIKGSWTMYWGQATFDLVDWKETGKTCEIPNDLYTYLAGSGNIYDVL